MRRRIFLTCASKGSVNRCVIGYQAVFLPKECVDGASIDIPRFSVGVLLEPWSPEAARSISATLGAEWIEKHLTLRRYMQTEDFVSAVEPDEFACYVGRHYAG